MLWNISEGTLEEFNQSYAKIHGRIAFPLTIFGLFMSVATIIVLQQKNFRTPTNLILQHIAFFDTIVLTSYNIYSLYFYILHDPNPFVGQSQFWPHFAILHSNVTVTAHSIALWLTCLLAIIRYTIISKPKQVAVQSSTVIILIWSVVLLICLLMIPNYLLWGVVRESAHKYYPKRYPENTTEVIYWISATTGRYLEKISFGILAIFFKMLPVLILIIFSVLLIMNIHHARQWKERLQSRCKSIPSPTNFTRELRTTTMLAFITLFTVVVEFPQGLFFIASGIDKYFFLLYSHLGDIWDITSIASSFITFIMYCSMSQQFRMEIYRIMCPKYLNKLIGNADSTHPQNVNISLMKQKQRIDRYEISDRMLSTTKSI